MQSSAMNWQSGDTTCETRAAGSNRRSAVRRWEVYPDKIITGAAEPLRRDIRDFADPSWLLRYWCPAARPATARPTGSTLAAGRATNRWR